MEAAKAGDQEGKNKVVFFIGKQKFEVADGHLKVRVLLEEYAKEDPAEAVLAVKRGNDIHKYTDLEEIIEVKDGTHFTVIHTGPTTVS